MARNPLSILNPAYHTVTFDGVPMFRAHAWALKDARLHGVKFGMNSGDRRQGVAEKYGKKSQAALFKGWMNRLPGYLPANPPGFSSHELRSDGNLVYKVPRGYRIPSYMLGMDADGASALVGWLNIHGYRAVQPYPSGSEEHHFSFTKSPATNARKRLAAYYAGRKR